jgi:pimeloyl-ACP methyl ester carboxylesterase
MKTPSLLLALLLACSWTASGAAPVPRAVIADPPADAAAPASMAAFVLPSGDGAMNAVFYLASGNRPHPTMLFLHGFPGNEQNLDLAQAARRAGWNVLTLHYRGSWGSSGAFSFAHAVEDSRNALAFLRRPENAARYRIDPRRIVVAGHSMGGFMAARASAEGNVLGTVMIDAWDIGADRAAIADPVRRRAMIDEELAGDMPPLAGTSIDALLAEIAQGGSALDLRALMPALARRPLLIVGASRAGGRDSADFAARARAAGGRAVTSLTMATDHSFSDHRIALASALVAWLEALPVPRR